MEITYSEQKPSKYLESLIECYWSTETHGDILHYSTEQRCLPLGMMELTFQLNGKSKGIINQQWDVFPDACLGGVMEFPVVWKMTGNSKMFGIRLKPEAIPYFFKIPISSIYNYYISLDQVIGNQANTLLQMLQDARSSQEMIKIAEAFFSNLIAQHTADDQLFAQVLNKIRAQTTSVSVLEISEELFVGERQLQRIFKQKLGMSPKAYQRISRFRKAYHTIKENPATPWVEVVYRNGYSDQAHFIRDFKEFTGMPPAKYKDAYSFQFMPEQSNKKLSMIA
jgi:AraC-like DNA-binding protein